MATVTARIVQPAGTGEARATSARTSTVKDAPQKTDSFQEKRGSNFPIRSSEDEEGLLEILPIPGRPEDERFREIRICCPDATGLGCDLTRTLVDAGLAVMRGDFSTDGKWAFVIFQVQVTSGYRPNWPRLFRGLAAQCPSSRTLWRSGSNSRRTALAERVFILQVRSYDRCGVLHNLVQALWDAELVVHRAQITTNPGGEVVDMFWVSDQREELPSQPRVLEVVRGVREALKQPQASCFFSVVAPEDMASGDARSVRVLNRDAKGQAPLRPPQVLGVQAGRRRQASYPGALSEAGIALEPSDGLAPARDVTVAVDNGISAEHTVVHVRCPDRKGLLYDILRVLKDADVSISYGRIEADPVTHQAFMEVFLEEDGDGTKIQDRDMTEELRLKVQHAIAWPVRITLNPVYDGAFTNLTVKAPVDSGGRGRPRVIYDVTRALSSAGFGVFMGDMTMELRKTRAGAEGHARQDDMVPLAADTSLLDSPDSKVVEVHRFLVHDDAGKPLSEADQQRVMDLVRRSLAGWPLAPAPAPASVKEGDSTHAGSASQHGPKPAASALRGVLGSSRDFASGNNLTGRLMSRLYPTGGRRAASNAGGSRPSSVSGVDDAPAGSVAQSQASSGTEWVDDGSAAGSAAALQTGVPAVAAAPAAQQGGASPRGQRGRHRRSSQGSWSNNFPNLTLGAGHPSGAGRMKKNISWAAVTAASGGAGFAAPSYAQAYNNSGHRHSGPHHHHHHQGHLTMQGMHPMASTARTSLLGSKQAAKQVFRLDSDRSPKPAASLPQEDSRGRLTQIQEIPSTAVNAAHAADP
ncbi:unnamed protein product [Pedinophyceae sp. YPF-701]|nr:unnamed protein product [Pedinophyceae sp. YPF-701]